MIIKNKTAKIIIPLIVLLLLSMCCKKVRLVTITGAKVQRVVFDNYDYKGCRNKIAYTFSLQYRVKNGRHFKWMNHDSDRYWGDEDICDIEITDSVSRSIKDNTSFIKRYGGADYGFVANNTPDSIEVHLNTYKNWKEAIEVIQGVPRDIFSGLHGIISEPILFYVDADSPTLEDFIIKFKDREIRAKVNNTPIVLHDISEEIK